MKIDKTSIPSPLSKAGETGSHASKARTTVSKAGTADNSGTSVHLGTSSAQLRSIEDSIANSPLMDAQKVAEIKQAISNGRFQVNSEAVADRLISTVQEMINASQH